MPNERFAVAWDNANCALDRATGALLFKRGGQSFDDLVAEAAAPEVPTAIDVREEAARRIVAAFPDWKQRNMTARGVDLLHIGPANWSPAEAAEAAALQAAWAWIKSVRDASNALEAAPPLDYRADAHWPPAA